MATVHELADTVKQMGGEMANRVDDLERSGDITPSGAESMSGIINWLGSFEDALRNCSGEPSPKSREEEKAIFERQGGIIAGNLVNAVALVAFASDFYSLRQLYYAVLTLVPDATIDYRIFLAMVSAHEARNGKIAGLLRESPDDEATAAKFDKRAVARWQTVTGVTWLELYCLNGAYSYEGQVGHADEGEPSPNNGVLPGEIKTDVAAVAWMAGPVNDLSVQRASLRRVRPCSQS